MESDWFQLAQMWNTIQMHLADSNLIPHPAQHAWIFAPSHTSPDKQMQSLLLYDKMGTGEELPF